VVRKRPWIVYPGALQGRHVGETGAKGCTLVRVDRGRVTAVEPRAVDVVRWQRAAIDAGGCADADEVLAACEREIAARLAEAEGRTLAVRVEVTGASPAHRELAADPAAFAAALRERAIDRFADRVWIEKIRLATAADFAVAPLLDAGDPVSELLAALRRPDALAPALAAVRAELDKLHDRLPADPRLDLADQPPLDLDDPLALDALAEEVERLLAPRLLGGDAG
jgi:DNA repair exonuclease SbcCD nuclease subunit